MLTFAITAFVVIALALNIWWSISAKRTLVVYTSLSRDAAAEIVDRAPSIVWWKRVDGPGDLDRRLRMPLPIEPPVVSFVLREEGSGAVVEMWMSRYSGVLGIANWGLQAVLLKRKVAKRLVRTPITGGTGARAEAP